MLKPPFCLLPFENRIFQSRFWLVWTKWLPKAQFSDVPDSAFKCHSKTRPCGVHSIFYHLNTVIASAMYSGELKSNHLKSWNKKSGLDFQWLDFQWLLFKWLGFCYGYSFSSNRWKTGPFKIWMFVSWFQMVFDKMAANCQDFKLLGFQIPFEIWTTCNPTSFWPFKI